MSNDKQKSPEMRIVISWILWLYLLIFSIFLLYTVTKEVFFDDEDEKYTDWILRQHR